MTQSLSNLTSGAIEMTDRGEKDGCANVAKTQRQNNCFHEQILQLLTKAGEVYSGVTKENKLFGQQ